MNFLEPLEALLQENYPGIIREIQELNTQYKSIGPAIGQILETFNQLRASKEPKAKEALTELSQGIMGLVAVISDVLN